MYAALFFLYTVVGSVFFQGLFHIGMNVGMQVKATIMAAVYKKVSMLSHRWWTAYFKLSFFVS